MDQIFNDDGVIVPVTVIGIEPCVVTQVKTVDHEGYQAVQIGYGKRKAKNIAKPQRGQFKELGNFAGVREFRVDDVSCQVGDSLNVEQFQVGDKVKVTGTSKGRGFQGVVKRHHFHGSPASHGHKDQLRHSGSIGAGGVQKVFKGMRMGGQMGNSTSTVTNLTIVKVDADQQQLYVRGAVPGARHSILAIYA